MFGLEAIRRNMHQETRLAEATLQETCCLRFIFNDQ